jgi:hypothetical protein
MKFCYFLASFAALALLPSTANALDECMATLKDAHGSVDVSCDEDIKATLKAGEHFLAVPASNGWGVYLKSGCNGFIEKVELQLLPNEPLMKLNYSQQKKLWQKWQSAPDAELGEAASSAKGRGLNYYKVLTAASNDDKKAMARFFSACEWMDGAAAEGCFVNGWELFHIVGDETFAKFLGGQSAKMREWIAGILSSGDTDPISKPKPYIKRYFPKSYKTLFGKDNDVLR